MRSYISIAICLLILTAGSASVRGQGSSEVVNIKVNIDSTVVKVNPLIFGVNTMFFMENKNALADGKIVKYLKELGVTTIRSGAEDADNYLWKTSSIADPNEWPGYQPPNSLPTIDDYIRMCQEIGAAPHITINLATFIRQGDVAAGVQNAVDLVRYLNIEHNYAVKYFELGNEPYTLGTAMRPSEYANDLIAFSKAMKAVDPSIKIVAVGSPGLAGTGMLEPIANGYERQIQSLPSGQRQKVFDLLSVTHPKPKALQELWWPTVIKIAADHFDAVAIHPYYMWGNANYTDFLNGSVKSDKRVSFVAQLRRYLDEHVPDRHIELALTEWNVGPQEGWENGPGTLDGMAAALMIAELLPAYLESGADIAHFWPLRRSTWRTNFRSLLDTNTNETRPPWHVLKLLAHNLGDKLVKVESSQQRVYAYAGIDDDTQRLALFIVNENLQPESILTQISVKGYDINDYRGTTLTAPELMSRQIQYQTPNATLGDGLVKVELPPHSLTMITIERTALSKAADEVTGG